MKFLAIKVPCTLGDRKLRVLNYAVTVSFEYILNCVCSTCFVMYRCVYVWVFVMCGCVCVFVISVHVLTFRHNVLTVFCIFCTVFFFNFCLCTFFLIYFFLSVLV
jgi:hypothetical protein